MGDSWEILSEDGKVIAGAASSFVPERGDLLNIRKQTYKVIGRTFTVDYADDIRRREVSCILTVVRDGD